MEGTIICVECGGTAHRMTTATPEESAPGQIVTYACEDCNHRLDVVQDTPATPPATE